jgi:hypothetical protein
MSAYNTLGYEVPETVINVDNYASLLDTLGIKDEVYRGQVFDASLAYAGAIGLGEGRALTDQDVERALKRMGKNWGTSKVARLAVLEDVGDTLINKFKTRYETWHTDSYVGDFGGEYRKLFGETGEFEPGHQKVQDGNIFEWDGTTWKYVSKQ